MRLCINIGIFAWMCHVLFVYAFEYHLVRIDTYAMCLQSDVLTCLYTYACNTYNHNNVVLHRVLCHVYTSF